MNLGRVGTILLVGGAAAAAGAAVYFATGGAAQAAAGGTAVKPPCVGQALQSFTLVTLSAGQQQSVKLCAPAGGRIITAAPVSGAQAMQQAAAAAVAISGVSASTPASQASASFGGAESPATLTLTALSGSTQGMGVYLVTWADASGKTNLSFIAVNITA
jgi:hypothetical protein